MRRLTTALFRAACASAQVSPVAILNHPENLNGPARWHTSSSGFFATNPFARHFLDVKAEPASKSLKTNESLRPLYRAIAHSGEFDVDASLREFAGKQAATLAAGQ